MNETFHVDLSNPINASFGDNQGTGTLTEIDTAPQLSVADTAADENAGTITFTVSLDTASEANVTFDWTTTGGTAVGGTSCSVTGTDYVSDSGTGKTISAGATSTTIDITICDDGVYADPAETFTLDISNPGNATISDSSGTGTLNEKDAEPQLSIADSSSTEGNTMTFTVSIDVASDTNVTVNWATSGGDSGTCGDGSDYQADSGTLTIPAGSFSNTFDITTCVDGTTDGDETFTVTLSSPSGATILDGTATGTINDAV